MMNARMLVLMLLIIGGGYASHADEHSEREQARRDQLHVAVQQICPVSSQRLGDHGPAIKVTVGEYKEQVFLCWRGCLQQKIDPRHWATIHANFAKAQRICPVMMKELPENPKWTIAEGHVFYVCCPPCTKKIADRPQTFLRALDELYAASLESENTAR